MTAEDVHIRALSNIPRHLRTPQQQAEIDAWKLANAAELRREFFRQCLRVAGWIVLGIFLNAGAVLAWFSMVHWFRI